MNAVMYLSELGIDVNLAGKAGLDKLILETLGEAERRSRHGPICARKVAQFGRLRKLHEVS